MMFSFDPIGTIHSPFKEKFGIPRQSGLMPEARAVLEILPPYDRTEAFRGLDQFSHIWLVFVFHGSIRETWRPTVRPPRLGGNRRIGVFATRSGFRPNPIGLSVVRLEEVAVQDAAAASDPVLPAFIPSGPAFHPATGSRCFLHIAGVDLLDGTPVLDIKPYLPYADAVPDADGGFAGKRPSPEMTVSFSPAAMADCLAREAEIPNLRRFIVDMLEADPRPAYCSGRPSGSGTFGRRQFGTRIFDIDVKWEYRENVIVVTAVVTR